MDQTDRLVAATIVAGMLTGEHALLGDRNFKNWPSIAKACFDCAHALSVERQSRRWFTNFAMFAAMRRASSRVSRLAAVEYCGSR
jgi:hypothetical protein